MRFTLLRESNADLAGGAAQVVCVCGLEVGTQSGAWWVEEYFLGSVNRELPDVQAALRKGQGTRDQIANIR